MIDKDEIWMRKAMEQAQLGNESGEVPVGCVIVCEDQVIAKGHNQTQLLKDPTAHAEMIAITSACEFLDGKYLKDCTLYVTLEPCPMCASAIHWAQVGKVVYAAEDEKRGFSKFSPTLLPNCKVSHGVKAEESSSLIQEFFRAKRARK